MLWRNRKTFMRHKNHNVRVIMRMQKRMLTSLGFIELAFIEFASTTKANLQRTLPFRHAAARNIITLLKNPFTKRPNKTLY